MKEEELVPAMVKVGLVVVTVAGVVVSTLGARVKALGVRFITRLKLDVADGVVREPVIVALPAESPQRPELATLTQRVWTVVVLVTAVGP
jgi:hypothetical protein